MPIKIDPVTGEIIEQPYNTSLAQQAVEAEGEDDIEGPSESRPFKYTQQELNPRGSAVTGLAQRDPRARSAFTGATGQGGGGGGVSTSDYELLGFSPGMGRIASGMGLAPEQAFYAQGAGAQGRDVKQYLRDENIGKWGSGRYGLGGSKSNKYFAQSLQQLAANKEGTYDETMVAKGGLMSKGFKKGEFHYQRGQGSNYGPAGDMFRLFNTIGEEKTRAIMGDKRFEDEITQKGLAEFGMKIGNYRDPAMGARELRTMANYRAAGGGNFGQTASALRNQARAVESGTNVPNFENMEYGDILTQAKNKGDTGAGKWSKKAGSALRVGIPAIIGAMVSAGLLAPAGAAVGTAAAPAWGGLGGTMAAGAVGGATTSFAQSLGTGFEGGVKGTALNVGKGAAIGGAMAGVGYGAGKAFTAAKGAFGAQSSAVGNAGSGASSGSTMSDLFGKVKSIATNKVLQAGVRGGAQGYAQEAARGEAEQEMLNQPYQGPTAQQRVAGLGLQGNRSLFGKPDYENDPFYQTTAPGGAQEDYV